MQKTLYFIVRLILGITFVISGILKGFDPIGLAYKIEEFLIFFSLYNWISFSRIFAGIICSFELAVGILLLLGIMRFWVGKIVVITMLLFTVFTLYLLKSPNVLSDCGCFGDALHLTHGESFAKNVLLLFISFIYVKIIPKRDFSRLFKIKYFYLFFAIVVYSISIPLYSFCRLPVIDFLPYGIGTVLIDHEDKNFKLGKESSPLILFNDSLDIVTTDFISSDKKTLLVTIRKPDRLSLKKVEILEHFVNIQADSLLIAFVVSTSSSKLGELLLPYGFNDFEILQTDDTALKSLLRCDNGLILVCKGVIRGKWNISELSDSVLSVEQLENKLFMTKYLYVSYILLGFLVLIFVRIKFF